MRHPLARALANVGLTADDVATRLAVDPKTVQRWFAGRVPYPRYRTELTELTGWAACDLWPSLARSAAPDDGADEVRVVYPRRSAVPAEIWHRLFERSKHDIGVLVYSGLFLAEDVAAQRILRDKSRAGVKVRIALGDKEGMHVARRGADEGIGDIMASRIRNAELLYRTLADEQGVEVRVHDTVLYNSIYWGDDEVLVNLHAYGCPASQAPVLHLRRTNDDGMTAAYLAAFEHVWALAHPIGQLERSDEAQSP